MKSKNLYTHHVSFKRIIEIAYPSILSMLSLNIMQFVDRTFVAQFNLTQFSAIMPASIFGMTVSSILLGISGYVTVLVSQYYGAKNPSNCSKSMWQGIYFSLIFGLFLLVSTPLTSQIFLLLGHSKDVLMYEKQFFYFVMITSFIQLFGNAISGFFNGIGDTRTPMITSILANVLNIFFDWILVFGNFGFPALGITGAGIATLSSTFISLVVLIIILSKSKLNIKYRFLKFYKFNKIIFTKLLKYGFPAGLQFCLGIGSFSFLLLIIGKMGEIPLVCANICFTIEGLSFLPILGLSNAVSIITGQEKGAKRVMNIPKVVRNGLMIAFSYNFIMICLFNFFPDVLISIFNSGKEISKFEIVKEYTIPLIRLTSIWLIFDSIQIIISGVLKSVGDTLFLLIVTGILPILLMVTPTYVLGIVFNLPLTWIWCGIIFFVIVLSFTMAFRFMSRKWEKIEII